MFSVSEKQKIAEAVERVLLELDHPEMPKERPVFHLHVDGKESWSWADIKPNWTFSESNPPGKNPWNESARKVLADVENNEQSYREKQFRERIKMLEFELRTNLTQAYGSSKTADLAIGAIRANYPIPEE